MASKLDSLGEVQKSTITAEAVTKSIDSAKKYTSENSPTKLDTFNAMRDSIGAFEGEQLTSLNNIINDLNSDLSGAQFDNRPKISKLFNGGPKNLPEEPKIPLNLFG